MNNRRRIGLVVAVLCVVMITTTLLVACKPGYKEVWTPIADYQYLAQYVDKTTAKAEVTTITQRVRDYRIDEEHKRVDKLKKENDERDMKGEKRQEDNLDPVMLNTHLNANGVFDNIDYNSTSTDYWHPIDHLTYLVQLQIGYNDPESPLYLNSDLKARIVNAMTYFVDNRGDKDGKLPNGDKALFYCDWNGWYNDIGIGMRIPDIMLFGLEGMDKAKSDKLVSQIESTLLYSKPLRFKVYERIVNEGGGNLTDQVLSTLKVSLYKKDTTTMYWLKTLLENELRPFPPYKGPGFHRWDAEGPKEDFSFQQHDQLIYFGGYGEVMLDGLTRYMKFTKNTQFQLNSKSLNFYVDFLLNGVQFATRNGFRDISASGRGIARRDGLNGIYTQLKNAVNMLLEYSEDVTSEKSKISDDRVEKLLQLKADRFDGEDKGAGGHRYFYESDYGVYNGDKYMASIRHASNRTRIFEYLNGENPLGYYTGLGATFYYVDGDEYFNTMPTYNWNKIPGTTTRQGIMPMCSQDISYGKYNNTKYAAGVSNGKVGCSYFRLTTDVVLDKAQQKIHVTGVTGKKAYFMFEDGVVCLGSDIDCILGNDVVTTVNQARWDGNVVVGQNGVSSVLSNAGKMNGKFDYIYHDKIAYFSKNNLELSLDKQVEGDWKRVSERNATSYIEKNDMFTLDINHGAKPSNESYEYTVLMNTNPAEARAYYANPTLIVLENNKNVQAVYDAKNGVVQAVFHKGGSINLPNGMGTINVNKGAVLIGEMVNGKMIFTISSNDYGTRKAKLTYNGTTQEVEISKRPTKVEMA